ncbi:ribosomal protein S18-alanine N-acetyltransferase [Paenibacillus physcomitrellae]|uniref:Ribosomal-protein-alanine acetyltransferase n=1 Tax=Paenibacillus physcomitrellae TaxID=1619311 RepID=A0ABQ1FTA7_9BACL|nr:ribosomal protein S18-alanine N-acetyltransferase [Paenibacillus physcomitrellae]GGA27576.1 ribosomal-protein-alanine acetyltransferase [Paenibacillus physcomitrellae]
MESENSRTNKAYKDEIVFRPMLMDDIPDIMIIEHESFTLPWSSDAFRNELTHNQFARYLVMERNGAPIGYAGMWTVLDEAHITNIAVRTAHRGQHLGELLLRQLMTYAWELGMIRMTLEVRVSNNVAQSLYEKLGFRGIGMRKGYYSDNGEDALIMWCDLSDKMKAEGGREGSETKW